VSVARVAFLLLGTVVVAVALTWSHFYAFGYGRQFERRYCVRPSVFQKWTSVDILDPRTWQPGTVCRERPPCSKEF
jgi:hypothetical protein